LGLAIMRSSEVLREVAERPPTTTGARPCGWYATSDSTVASIVVQKVDAIGLRPAMFVRGAFRGAGGGENLGTLRQKTSCRLPCSLPCSLLDRQSERVAQHVRGADQRVDQAWLRVAVPGTW
jgi:hypothetical protein